MRAIAPALHSNTQIDNGNVIDTTLRLSRAICSLSPPLLHIHSLVIWVLEDIVASGLQYESASHFLFLSCGNVNSNAYPSVNSREVGKTLDLSLSVFGADFNFYLKFFS